MNPAFSSNVKNGAIMAYYGKRVTNSQVNDKEQSYRNGNRTKQINIGDKLW
jgi:hypothetical protein